MTTMVHHFVRFESAISESERFDAAYLNRRLLQAYRLGLDDDEDRRSPCVVPSLQNKTVSKIACGREVRSSEL